MAKLLGHSSIPLIAFVLILLASTEVAMVEAKICQRRSKTLSQTPETATVNAETGKLLCTELVTLNSRELLASATSDVDSRSTNSSRQQAAVSSTSSFDTYPVI